MYENYDDQNKDVTQILQAEYAHKTENKVAENEAKVTRGWSTQPTSSLMDMYDDDIIPDFDLKDLRRLAGGPYQLRLAIPYYRHSQNVKFMANNLCPNTIKTMGIVSRHSRNDDSNVTRYQVYHRFDDDNNFSKTLSFCSCNVGMGTSSLCAHMTASLYILWHRLEGKEIPKQHPRTDRHMVDTIDLYYWKIDRYLQEDGAASISVDDDDDAKGNMENEEDEELDMTQHAILWDISDDSDSSNESDGNDPHQVRIRIMDLVRRYAGSDGEENTVDRVDNPADWSSCSDHDSDHDVLDIENDTDLDEYVLDRWGLYREKEPERDINYYNHNHR